MSEETSQRPPTGRPTVVSPIFKTALFSKLPSYWEMEIIVYCAMTKHWNTARDNGKKHETFETKMCVEMLIRHQSGLFAASSLLMCWLM